VWNLDNIIIYQNCCIAPFYYNCGKKHFNSLFCEVVFTLAFKQKKMIWPLCFLTNLTLNWRMWLLTLKIIKSTSSTIGLKTNFPFSFFSFKQGEVLAHQCSFHLTKPLIKAFMSRTYQQCNKHMFSNTMK
jgi:hypothetical protein